MPPATGKAGDGGAKENIGNELTECVKADRLSKFIRCGERT